MKGQNCPFLIYCNGLTETRTITISISSSQTQKESKLVRILIFFFHSSSSFSNFRIERNVFIHPNWIQNSSWKERSFLLREIFLLCIPGACSFLFWSCECFTSTFIKKTFALDNIKKPSSIMKTHSSTTEHCEWSHLQGQAFLPKDQREIYYLNRETKGERAQPVEKAIVSLSRDCGV